MTGAEKSLIRDVPRTRYEEVSSTGDESAAPKGRTLHRSRLIQAAALASSTGWIARKPICTRFQTLIAPISTVR